MRQCLLALLLFSLPPGNVPVLAQSGGDEVAQLTEEELGRLREVRLSYLRYWEELGYTANRSGLERFARLVQEVVDTRMSGVGPSRLEPARLVLDDLVDLFVSGQHALEKRMAMSTPSVLYDDVAGVGEEDLSGFAPAFRRGEGRYRHFVLNAAMSYSAPAAVVELLARLRGGDLTGSSPDSRADRATNRLGQEFSRLLREQPPAELRGSTVYDWLMESFGERPTL